MHEFSPSHPSFSKVARQGSTLKPHFSRIAAFLAVAGGGFGLISPAAQAAVIGYNVNLGTLPLVGQDRDGNGAADTYRLDFFFNNGGAAGNSSARLSNFSFGSSGAGTAATPSSFTDSDAPVDGDGFPIPTPAASGTLTTPGDRLGFNLSFNYTVDAPSPDQFSLALFNTGAGQYISTGSGDGISLFTIDFAAGAPNVTTFASQGSPGNPDYGLAAPSVTVAPVPEPSTCAMMAFGIGALGLMTWKRKRSQSPPTTDLVGVAI